MNNNLLKLLKFSLFSISMAAALPANAESDIMRLTSVVVDMYAEDIYMNSGATGMALVVIDNNQVVNRSYGETKPGNNIHPRPDSLIRIASITKLMTSEVMVKMAQEGRLQVIDPLQKYVPVRVPNASPRSPIRLYHLATHTSGIPREQPGRPPKATVFTWPTKSERMQWLGGTKLTTVPGESAAYSNLAYDLLADALSKAAGKPYTTLFREKVTGPLGMLDTTYTPTAEQCARLMIGTGAGPCKNGLAAIGSGGVYSTPQDIQRWMQQFLADAQGRRTPTMAEELKIYFQRSDLNGVKGMDVPGQADGLGLGWVYMEPRNGQVGMLQKTGGGGGFMTYMAMVPEKNIGVFVVVTRSAKSKFTGMSNGVNQLISDLAR